MIRVTVHVIMNIVGIPEKCQRGLENDHKNASPPKKKFILLVTSYCPNTQHIVNSSVNGGRGPSDELHDVRNVLETKTAGKWVYFL